MIDASLEPAVPARPENALSDLTRLAVAAQTRRGEEDLLWRQARPRLLRIALALRVPVADAPDIVQDVLIAAHRALARFDPARGTFEGWLGAILVRRARNFERFRRRRDLFLDALRALGMPIAARAPVDLEPVEARMLVDRLLGGLSASQREVVALYEIGGFSADETAGILRLTPAGVRSIARDARRRLAEAARGPAGAATEGP